MRVLHLPVNIASFPSHTVRGLRQIGIDARGLVFGNAPVQSADTLKVIQPVSRRRPHRWAWRKLLGLYYFLRWVAWADVVHWYFGASVLPLGLDLRYVKVLNKPGVVEWLGSDIRIPEVDFPDNPYYKNAFYSGYEYPFESLQHSSKRQRRFAEAGFACMTSNVMLRYIQRDIFPEPYIVPARLIIDDYQPVYPEPDTRCPIIVHSPTAPIAKGTPAVLNAIEQLKHKFNFEFRLVQGIPRSEALRLMQKADIFLDQFVSGYHGMAALEAMAFGKPVLCYIMPAVINEYPSDCPIINTPQENLVDTIAMLLKDGKMRREIGRRGRAYVEKYHDAVKVARRLVEIYQEVIERTKKC